MTIRFLYSALLSLLVFLPPARANEIVWIEAERFDEVGGWKCDPQFIDQMGSPFLLAVGLGEPVDDARTVVVLPRSGRYRVWVRTRDWVPEHHPGRFEIVLDGRALDRVFGADGKAGWHWEDGGVRELSTRVEVRLRDRTGDYGRCDAVVLASDPAWTPPHDEPGIAALRERLGGVSPEVVDVGPYDVVVVGGGLAGCTAAVAAARNGARVALIQNRPVLGGNASTEILVPPVGAWPSIYRAKYPLDPRETGIVEEYRTAGNQRVDEGKLYSSRLLRLVRLEPNLDLHLDTHATGVEMAPGPGRRIAAVLAVDTHSGRRSRFRGKTFIDCTGDSVVGAAAGAEFRHGKEPKSMYDEPWADDEPSPHTMGNGLKYFAKPFDSPQPYEAPDWAFDFPTCESFGPERHPVLTTSSEIGHQWKIELGGLRDTYADAEAIRDDLLRLIYGLWDHTKNHCPRDRERAANYRLVWVGYIAGKRENRRLMGDYVLTQNDIGRQTLFADRIAFGAWSVDDHYSGGFFHDGATAQHRDRSADEHRGVPYSIPFRCLYSKNVDNLLMAGRNISASHLAMSNARVMLTCAILGHAAGTASAMCVDKRVSPRTLSRDHLAELQQQLLKEGAAIFELKADDPRDLAPKAAVGASSYRTHTSGEVMRPENVVNGFARAVGERSGETTNAWAADPDAAPPHGIELNWPEPIAMNVVHVTFQTADLAPRWFTVEAKRDGAWTTIAEVSDNRHRRHVLGLDRVTTSAIRVVLDVPAAVCEIRVYDEPERVVEIARRAHRNMRLADEGPFLPWGDDDDRPPGVHPRKLDGIVIDDSELQPIGVWSSSTWAERFIGQGYLTDGNEAKGQKSLVCRPRLPASGRYEIRLAYSAFGNRAGNVPVTVRGRSGPSTVRVDQREAPPIDGLFVSLGTFDLERGKATIEISNEATDGYVVVDALQLLRQEAP